MKKLEIRQLKFNDAYKAAEILKNIKIDITEKELNDLSYSNGIKIILNALSNAKYCKNEINAFLGSLFDISGEEFGNLNLKESAHAIKQLKKLEGMEDFLDLVKGLTK